MAKPPPDADPEKFIIGDGNYNNLQTAIPTFHNGIFRLDPTPIPYLTILLYNLIYATFFYGFHYLLKHFGGSDPVPWQIDGFLIALASLTCILFTIVVYYSFAKANRLGPWLTYNTQTGQLDLPRQKTSFPRNQILHLQYITTKRLNWGGVVNNDRLSELNLITLHNGTQKRWPLLRSIFNKGAFDRLLKPLLQHTDLPVMRVQDEWLGWNVTEHPYTLKPSKN